MAVVVDAFAFIYWMEKETSLGKVHQLLHNASLGAGVIYFSSLCASELYYQLLKHTGEEQSRLFFNDLKKRVIPVELVPFTNKRAWNSAKWMRDFSLTLPKAFNVSLAVEFNASLLTGDLQYKEPADTGVIEVDWLQ